VSGTWVCDLPRAEAKRLAEITFYDGARCPLPGEISHDGNGRVRLDDDAMMSLAIMYGRPGFGLRWRGDWPVLVVGGDEYPLEQEDGGRGR
jgi:hypothetical protein